MKRALTILDGPAKGRTEPLDKTLIIIGRSRHADLQLAEDPSISKRHLEVRAEPDAVFVENLSPHGTSLNGKPLSGAVSLNPGDVLTIGQTKMRFEEAAAKESETEGDAPSAAAELETGGTVEAPAWMGARQERDSEADPDKTRALALEATRMADPKELASWRSSERKTSPLVKLGMLVGLLALLGAGFAVVRYVRSGQTSGDGTGRYVDPGSLFTISYPAGWSRISTKPDSISFGTGTEDGQNWARMNVYFSRQAEHALTGQRDGFEQYREALKAHFKGYEEGGHQPMNVGEAKTLFFWFKTPTLRGKGIYLHNGDARIVVECFSPNSSYEQLKKILGDALMTLRLDPSSPQQFIEYPPPDSQMQLLALTNSVELARQSEELARVGDGLIREKDIKPENLFEAVRAYQAALRLIVAGPQRLPSYASVAQRLAEATKLYNEAVAEQRFEMQRAIKDRDGRAACLSALKLMQQVPDKTDRVYQQASKTYRTYQSYLREQP